MAEVKMTVGKGIGPGEAPLIRDASGKEIKDAPEDLYDEKTLELLKKSGIIK